MNPDSLAYQFAALLHFEGELDERALRGALGDLMARHEVLRSSIEERDGEPVQVVHEQVEVPLEVVDLPGELERPVGAAGSLAGALPDRAGPGAAGALDAGPPRPRPLVADRRRAPCRPRRLVLHARPLRARRALLEPGRAAGAATAAHRPAPRRLRASGSGRWPAARPSAPARLLAPHARPRPAPAGAADEPPAAAPRVLRRRLGAQADAAAPGHGDRRACPRRRA